MCKVLSSGHCVRAQGKMAGKEGQALECRRGRRALTLRPGEAEVEVEVVDRRKGPLLGG